MGEGAMAIEVVYALPETQAVISMEVPEGTTVAEAIARSGLAERFPHAALEVRPVGLHGRIVSRDTPVCEGDRVEIYRPLAADPKQARRQRASRAR